MRIKTFLTIVFGIFALAAVIAFAVSSSYELNSEIEKNFTRLVAEQSEKQTANADLFFKSAEGGFNALAESLRKADDPVKFANEYRAGRADIIDIVFDTPAVLGGIDLSKYEDGKFYLYSEEETKPAKNVGLWAKADVGGKTVFVTYSGGNLKSLIGSSTFPSGRLLLLDPSADRNIIDLLPADGDSYLLGTLTDARRNNSRSGEYEKLESPITSSASSVTYTVVKNEYAANIAKVGGSGWLAVTVGDITAAKKDATGSTGIVLVVTIILCIAGLVMTGVTVSIFTKPLDAISRTIFQIRRGDHDARIRVMSRNEYGEVARLFNDLIDDIVVGEARYRTIIEMSDNIIFEWNLKTNEVVFSNNFNKKFSFRAPSDHFTDSFLLKCKVHPDDAARYRQDLEALSKGAEFKHNEYRIKNIYGDWVWFLFRTAAIKDENGEPFKIIGVMVDIDRAKKTEENLSARASYDALTNVYNRDSIESLIENEIELISVRKDRFAVLFVDIDDFKDFNDKYSHATGDQVLKFTAETLTKIVQGFGMVGRYGGDEFVVCARNSDVNRPDEIAKEILARLKEGYTADTGDHISIDASIGVIVVRDSSKRIEMVVGAADDAMYKIKKSGKSNFTIIDEQ